MKLIDADKLLKWIDENIDSIQRWNGRVCESIAEQIEEGTFDPTPPVQPDIKPGDKVRHKDKAYQPYGIGVVKEISKSGKQAYVHWPEYDKKHFKWGPPTPSYYRLDKLEVITDGD